MKIFNTKEELSNYLGQFKKHPEVIGFVPTMGALHEGHLALIKIANAQSDVVVCSIFINPTQFNDPKDFEKYPKTIEEDIKKLEKLECDVLFLPDVQEMYPKKEEWHFNLGELEKVLEARSRPGHYQGVTQIVKKLLDAIKPDQVYFGQKDYQQFLVIERMVRSLRIPVKLIMCPIVRDKDGLALSSRNIRLSDEQRKQTLALSQALNLTKSEFKKKSIKQLKADGIAFLGLKGIEPDYFEICNAKTLKAASSKRTSKLIVLVAAYVGGTRLIDNLLLT
ncbi:MAG TPA: pantoate--beta-alanine ligase [Sphingobacteriaceae bacterium]|nr:pantoate--beta-alanine ligase [Sphingobacteriaceae bacterium]